MLETHFLQWFFQADPDHCSSPPCLFDTYTSLLKCDSLFLVPILWTVDSQQVALFRKALEAFRGGTLLEKWFTGVDLKGLWAVPTALHALLLEDGYNVTSQPSTTAIIPALAAGMLSLPWLTVTFLEVEAKITLFPKVAFIRLFFITPQKRNYNQNLVILEIITSCPSILHRRCMFSYRD